MNKTNFGKIKIAGILYLFFFFFFYQNIVSQDLFDGFEVPGEEKVTSEIPSETQKIEEKEEEKPLDTPQIPVDTKPPSSEENIFQFFDSGNQPTETPDQSTPDSVDVEEMLEKKIENFLQYFNLYNNYKKIRRVLKQKPQELKKEEVAKATPSKKEEPQIQKPQKEESKKEASFDDFAIPGETPAEPSFDDFAIPGETKEETSFGDFTIPEEVKTKEEPKSVFDGFDIPEAGSTEESPQTETPQAEAPQEKQLEGIAETTSSEILDISHISELEGIIEETKPEKQAETVVPKTPKKPSGTLPDQEMAKVPSPEELPPFMDGLPALPEPTFSSESAQEEEDDTFFPLSMRALFEYNVFGVSKNSLYNPKNVFNIAHNYSRILVKLDFSHPLYDNDDISSPFKVNFEFRDTVVYRSKTDTYADDSVENYIQEVFLNMVYQRLNLSIGKKNVKPGEGGGYAWNVVDVFAHNSSLYEANAGNWNKRGDRPGIYGVYGRYSFDFADLSFAYTPDLTKKKNGQKIARNDTEFLDNTSDIFMLKFSWRNLFTKDLLGKPPSDITPSAPDFIFSYRSNSLVFVESGGQYIPVYKQDDTYNFGMVWSVGIGDSIIVRTELNYSTRTDIQEMKQTGEFFPGGPKQFGFERRDGSNFGIVLSFAYTFSDITLDLEYYYNSNGYSHDELEDYYDNVKYINTNYTNPLPIPIPLKDYYFGKLAHAISFDSNTLGQHYGYVSLSRSWNIGKRKRELSVRALNILSLQDFSGSAAAFVTYKFFNYANLQLDFNYFYGKEKSIFGSNPYEWMLLGTFEFLF